MIDQHEVSLRRESEPKQGVHPPSTYRLVASEEELQKRMAEVARDITNWLRRTDNNPADSAGCSDSASSALDGTGRNNNLTASHDVANNRDVIVAPVMRGAVFFAADLTRELGESVEIQPVRVSSYAGNRQQKRSDEVHIDLGSLQPLGRRILIVDDICDSGRTIALLAARLLEEGAAEVKSAVLVYRDLTQEWPQSSTGIIPPDGVEPDFVVLRFSGHEWLAGYGLEDNERYRNLRGVYAIPTPSG